MSTKKIYLEYHYTNTFKIFETIGENENITDLSYRSYRSSGEGTFNQPPPLIPAPVQSFSPLPVFPRAGEMNSQLLGKHVPGGLAHASFTANHLPNPDIRPAWLTGV